MSASFLATCAQRAADAEGGASTDLSSLPVEAVGCCLAALSTWGDAAAAAAVCRSWRALLKGGCWPADATAGKPLHWLSMDRFGCNWEESRAFVHPEAWTDPASLPSWTWALQAFHNHLDRTPKLDRTPHEDSVEGLLSWLDRMAHRWPGVAVPRWAGLPQRLAWLHGHRSIDFNTARGCVPRRWPPFEGSPIQMNSYRGGGHYSNGAEAVPPCPFDLPVDAALFYALLPEGFGEHSDSDGATNFAGFEVVFEPWLAEGTSYYARKNNLANIRRFSAERLEANPAKLLPVAHEMRNKDFDSPGASSLEQTTLFVCCDLASRHYGEIFCLEVEEQEEELVPVQLVWWGISFADLLSLMLDAVDEVVEAHPTIPRNDWDSCHAIGLDVVHRLFDLIERRLSAPPPEVLEHMIESAFDQPAEEVTEEALRRIDETRREREHGALRGTGSAVGSRGSADDAATEALARATRAGLFAGSSFRNGALFQFCLAEAQRKQAAGMELDELDRTVLGPPL